MFNTLPRIPRLTRLVDASWRDKLLQSRQSSQPTRCGHIAAREMMWAHHTTRNQKTGKPHWDLEQEMATASTRVHKACETGWKHGTLKCRGLCKTFHERSEAVKLGTILDKCGASEAVAQNLSDPCHGSKRRIYFVEILEFPKSFYHQSTVHEFSQ